MKWSVPLAISVLFVLGKLQSTEALTCIECADCPDATGIVTTVDCEMGCGIWKNDNGFVERGCSSGGSANLIVCFSEKCNIDPVPVCHQCTTLENCEGVVCDNLKDECYVSKTDDNGVVERGCSGGGGSTIAVNLINCNVGVRCNGAPVPVCQQCLTLEDCKENACDKLKDDCYVSRTDERRGCTSDGIYTNDDDFQTCPSNNCNRVASCVVCNSDNGDANCLDEPDSYIQSCEGHGLVTEDENCYRYEVSKEQFQLGCTTALDFPEKCDVNECKKCGPDICNQREFQSCYECSDCRTIEKLDPFNCADYNSTCLIAYDRFTKTTNRACTEDSDPSIYGQILYECSESNCNDGEFPTNRQCYQNDIPGIDYCDSLDATRCFTQKDADGATLNRGCDTDSGFGDCVEFENCLICDSDGCNIDESQVQVQCAICTNAEECRDPVLRECDQAEFYDGCYMYQGTEGTLLKGCLNELVAGETDVHRACTENEETCQKCTGLNCNAMHCLSCNSQDGLECVAGEDNVPYGFCPMGDKCRMFVDDKGYTVRGCSSKFEDPMCDDVLCQENEGPASNGGLFPQAAMQCYQCTEDCDAVKPEQLDYCSQNEVPGCYYKFDGKNIVSRGCLSEEALNCGNDPNCYECVQGEGCNSVEPWECYNCNGGEDCVDDATQTCKTIFNCAVYIDGNDVTRTCINDSNFCDQNPGKCENICKEDKCNNNGICATMCSDEMCNEICSSNESKEKCFRYQNKNELQLGCIDKIPEICNTEENHCSTCAGNFCNAAELAECFTCTTDCSTVDGVGTVHCKNPDDTCLTGTDENGEVFRGCTEDFNLDDLSDYTTCSGAACNLDIIGNSCYQCENCTKLEDVLPKSCSIPNFTGCYTVQDLESKTIDRGCVSDSGLDSCKENINCLKCDDKDCNGHEVRTVPLLCSSCSGQNCSDYTPAEQCSKSVGSLIDRCVTFSAFGVTSFKGCLSDGIPPELESDCYKTQTFCAFCDEDYCNTPDLSCFSCSTSANGIECITNPTKMQKTDCKANGLCVTYVEDDGHLHRGCSNDLDQLCSIEDPFCKSCDGLECNVHILPVERISCYQCDGNGCQASELQSSDSKPCLVYDEGQFCYTYAEDNLTAHRGCSNDKSASVCDDEPCVFCNYTDCNIQKTVQPKLSCIQCPSNSACEGQAFGRNCTVDQLLGRSDQCYTLYVRDLIIEKGCLSDLPSTHPWYGDCLEGNDDRCRICSDNDCNRGTALCYKCNSDEDDDCSELVSTSQYLSECQAECLTLVDANGYTKRGCVEDFPDECESSSQSCAICQGKLCNDIILPEDRQRCYVCQGSKPECFNPTPGLAKACPLYKPNDECFTRFENSTWVERGCLSSIGEETCADECVKCPSDGCNEQKAYQPNSLSCVTCEADACSGMVVGQQCSKQILLGRQDYCYEYTDEDMVSKGCLSDLNEGSKIKEACESSQEGLCRLCSQDDCNGDIFNCVSCDSSINPECVEEWMKPVSPDMLEICEGRRCVSYVDDNGFIQKGCSNETNSCKQGDTNCYECDESMCNNAAFPEDRLACHRCEKCNYPIATDRPVACSKYSSNQACYTYVIDESIYRGCLLDTQLECTETCLTCNSNGCNDHPYEFESSLSCVQCNSARECQDNSEPKLCDGTLNLGSTDQCFSFSVNNEIIQKGCRQSFPDCSEQGNCELCGCDGCNLVSTSSDNVSCIVCEGEDCGNEQFEVDHCDDKACISYVSKEGIVSRGCLKHFDKLCSSYGSKHETCYEPNCNNGLFPAGRIKCHRCEDCGIVLGRPEICPTYLERDGCFTALSADRSTVSRGCISERKTACYEPLCSFCTEEGCNGEDQLNTTTTETPGSTTTSTEDSSTTTEEGTSTSDVTSTEVSSTTTEEGTSTSDVTSTEVSLTTTEEGSSTSDVSTTSTEDSSTTTEESTSPNDGSTSTISSEEITTTTVATTSPLTCIRCRESVGVACAWGFQPNSAEQCLTDAESGCFTCRQEDNRIVRGCSSDQSQSACSDESIEECNEPGCNNANQRTQRCAICERNCDGSNASYQVQECDGIVEYANRGCYLFRNERRIVTERGCVSVLGADRRRDCENSRDQCVICYNDGCNTAMMVRVLNGLIAAAIVVTVVRTKLF